MRARNKVKQATEDLATNLEKMLNLLIQIEFALIKTHAETGYEIIKDIDSPWPIADMILQHHERLDGSGYPHGKKGDEIILEARILAVADVVEAMASHHLIPRP